MKTKEKFSLQTMCLFIEKGHAELINIGLVSNCSLCICKNLVFMKLMLNTNDLSMTLYTCTSHVYDVVTSDRIKEVEWQTFIKNRVHKKQKIQLHSHIYFGIFGSKRFSVDSLYNIDILKQRISVSESRHIQNHKPMYKGSADVCSSLLLSQLFSHWQSTVMKKRCRFLFVNKSCVMLRSWFLVVMFLLFIVL